MSAAVGSLVTVVGAAFYRVGSALRRPPALLAVAVTAGLTATRFVRLDDAPSEWYGDISTVYEYVVNIRNGTSPNGYHQLGTGALYPEVIRPVLWLRGDSYLSIKTAGALCSLVGLLILFRLCRSIVNTNFGLLTTVLAGTSMWWLIFSRLGDVQALTPTLSLAAVACAFATIRNPGVLRWPAACGFLSTLGLYLYGNTIVLPLITGLYLVVGWHLKRATPRTIGVWSIFVVATAAPLANDLIRDPNIVTNGHDSQLFVGGWDALWNMVTVLRKALWSYVASGDRSFRGNLSGAPHIDSISLAFGIVGIAFWLGSSRRRTGIAIIGTFALLHLPMLLVRAEQAPSASRTVAAAPFAYIIIAGGVWWTGQQFLRLGRTRSVVMMSAIVACIAALNISTYIYAYLPGLPYGNIPIARSIVNYVDELPGDVEIHLVGTGWSQAGAPEIKSILYAAKRPQMIEEDDPATFDCRALETLVRPAVLIWSFDTRLPGQGLENCESELQNLTTVTFDGVPTFRTAQVG